MPPCSGRDLLKDETAECHMKGPKRPSYVYGGIVLVGGFTALLGVGCLVLAVQGFRTDHDLKWKALGFGVFFLLLAVGKVYGILWATGRR